MESCVSPTILILLDCIAGFWIGIRMIGVEMVPLQTFDLANARL